TKVRTKRHWRPRSFTLDFAPGEAVSVSRRLYLSGESEYQLNGKACRLRDIQDLFAGTGLSGSHYAIIEQGRIGQILSAKPADRRNLIEEAAGISKFRTRQRAAETRLESARTNLGRISDIVSEIDKNVNSLRRQASKTRRFKVLQEEFRALLRQAFAAEGRHLSGLAEELKVGAVAAVEVERGHEADIEAKESAVRLATQTAREAEENLAELRKLHAESALERDRAVREHRYLIENRSNLETRSEALRLEIAASAQRLTKFDAEFRTLEEEEKKEQTAAGKAEIELRKAEEDRRSRVEGLQSIEAQLDDVRGSLLKHTAALERCDEIGRQAESNREKLAEKAIGLELELERAVAAGAEHANEAEGLAQDLETEQKKLATLQVEKNSIVELTVAARSSHRETEGALSVAREEYSRRKHRLETLIELDEKRAVYAPPVQKLFAVKESIGIEDAQVLADLLEVDEKAERAVENLFGNYLQTVIVESDANARAAAEWLHSNEIGRLAILVRSIEEPERPKFAGTGGDIGSALGLPDDLTQLLRRILPREMSAILVESFDSETYSDGQTLVNYQGDLLIGGKLFVAGQVSGKEKNESLLAFKRELRGLEKLSVKLLSDVEKASAVSEAAGRMVTEHEEKTVDLQSLIIKVERHLHALEMQVSAAKNDVDRAARHQRVVAEDIKRVELELAELSKIHEMAKSNAAAADSERLTAANRMEMIAATLSDAREAAESENVELNEKRMIAATSLERQRSVQTSIKRLNNEEKELKSRLALQDLELKEASGKVDELGESIVVLATGIAASTEVEERESADLQRSVDILDQARHAADALSYELGELNKRSADARNYRAEIEVKQAEAVTQLKSIYEKCRQELSFELADLILEPTDGSFNLDEGREQVEDLRKRLENFGAINMLALEELGEAEERLIFLTSQRQDIIDSISATEEALREIKQRSRERFKRAFGAINENFVEFFQELFGGGRGEMTLLESDDVLEAGIEIVAQPPGKRLQNILLLSGGEKAMTAIALVLAIFKYRPSPFCLLDEVDAPLDDANVGRFVNKIAAMSEKTQFIVITHNKRTMEAARALYGVTMQEAGVSKVVSVKFE
ncbi:MAG: chromosome segregation protein SMC, partial [Pyrinomonadaceae bacterium]